MQNHAQISQFLEKEFLFSGSLFRLLISEPHQDCRAFNGQTNQPPCGEHVTELQGFVTASARYLNLEQ